MSFLQKINIRNSFFSKDPTGEIYYFNFATGESIWDHPCDEYYRGMVEEERIKLEMSGGTVAKKAADKKNSKKKSDKKAKTLDFPDKVLLFLTRCIFRFSTVRK